VISLKKRISATFIAFYEDQRSVPQSKMNTALTLINFTKSFVDTLAVSVLNTSVSCVASY